MADLPRIALLFNIAEPYGRGVLRGIADYTVAHQPWAFDAPSRGPFAPLSRLEGWTGDGIIAGVTTPELAAQVRATGRPVVNIASLVPAPGLASVVPHNAAVGRLAAVYFLDRGFRHFAYCGFRAAQYSEQRGRGFAEHLRAHGFDCAVMDAPGGPGDDAWIGEQAALGDWLDQQPQPLAVLAASDLRAWHVLSACRACRIQVPEEVAVLGVDDSDPLCDLADPPLSSIALPLKQIGFEAAALLDRMMNGEATPPATHDLLIEPVSVVTRHSSDVLALEDRDVAAAMRFIWRQAHRPLRVTEIATAIGLSRRSLERRFRAALSRSPHDEIRRVHIERAKTLLAETDAPMSRVSVEAGFRDAKQLSAVFREQTGMTPTRYRAKYRRG